jgi:hypothetical protein
VVRIDVCLRLIAAKGHLNNVPVPLCRRKYSIFLAHCSLRNEEILGSRYIDLCIVNVDTCSSWGVRLTPLPPYLRGNSPRYTFDIKLDISQKRFQRRRMDKKLQIPGYYLLSLRPPCRTHIVSRLLAYKIHFTETHIKQLSCLIVNWVDAKPTNRGVTKIADNYFT